MEVWMDSDGAARLQLTASQNLPASAFLPLDHATAATVKESSARLSEFAARSCKLHQTPLATAQLIARL